MTSFSDVAKINRAFGNPKGRKSKKTGQLQISERFINQVKNIAGDGSTGFLQGEIKELYEAIAKGDIEGIRDALCDAKVFIEGAQHILGVNGDKDMKAVTTSLYSRLIKDQATLDLTVAKYSALGVETYQEGKFPTMALKVMETVIGTDGEEYVKGKFLKAVGYSTPVFPAV